jgi:hypothetical protein
MNRDDVAQFAVALQRTLHGTGRFVVVFTHTSGSSWRLVESSGSTAG